MAGVTWMTPINIPNSARYRSARRGHQWQPLSSAAETGARFGAFARAMHRFGRQHRLLTETTSVNLGGSLVQGGINGIGLCGQTFVAVDRSGGATNNNVYMLASVQPIQRQQRDRRDVRTQHRWRTDL